MSCLYGYVPLGGGEGKEDSEKFKIRENLLSVLIYYLIFRCVRCLKSPTAKCMISYSKSTSAYSATLHVFSIIVTDLRGLKTVSLELWPNGKHYWINVRDNDRGTRGQNFRRLAQVTQVPGLPNALISFLFLLRKLDLRYF